MISAKDATQKTLEAQKKLAAGLLGDIEIAINRACDQGCRGCRVEGRFHSNAVLKTLKELGYLHCTYDAEKEIYDISW